MAAPARNQLTALFSPLALCSLALPAPNLTANTFDVTSTSLAEFLRTLAGTRQIPCGASSLKWSRVIRRNALHRDANERASAESKSLTPRVYNLGKHLI